MTRYLEKKKQKITRQFFREQFCEYIYISLTIALLLQRILYYTRGGEGTRLYCFCFWRYGKYVFKCFLLIVYRIIIRAVHGRPCSPSRFPTAVKCSLSRVAHIELQTNDRFHALRAQYYKIWKKKRYRASGPRYHRDMIIKSRFPPPLPRHVGRRVYDAIKHSGNILF